MAKRPRERSSEQLDVRTLETTEAQPITNDIASFLTPVDTAEFLRDIYQKKALAIKVHPRLRQARLEHIKEVLFGFNPVQMLQASNSERINVWMGGDKTIHSVKVGPEEAKGCYDAGCGLYFRASEDLEAEFVPAFSEALGHSFASFFRDAQRRGEIETFVTHVGHTTEWHTDFQENFTVQLRGAKRWFLRRGPVENTFRAFAPHFKNTKVLHTQTQIIRAGNPEFTGLPEDIDETCESIVLQPGDVLYHPAGMFHKVETIAVGEDRSNSLSINISLFPESWSEFISESTQQLCLTIPEAREMVRFTDLSDAHAKIRRRLDAIANGIKALKPAMLLPKSVLSPIGVVTIRAKGVQREDGVVVSNKDEEKLKGPWVRNPLGVLSRTPEDIAIPLRQRPAAASHSDSEDDEEEEDSDDDDGTVEIAEGAHRFDYHANFVAEEGNIGMLPAVHCTFVVYTDALPEITSLSKIAGNAEVKRSMIKIPGLLSVLLDLGVIA